VLPLDFFKEKVCELPTQLNSNARDEALSAIERFGCVGNSGCWAGEADGILRQEDPRLRRGTFVIGDHFEVDPLAASTDPVGCTVGPRSKTGWSLDGLGEMRWDLIDPLSIKGRASSTMPTPLAFGLEIVR